MANFLSDQLTNEAANPPVMNDSTTIGKLRRKFFHVTAVQPGAGDTVQLIKVAKYARVFAGRIGTPAWGGSNTFEIGDGTTATKFLGSTSGVSAASTDFANTVALGGLGSVGDVADAVGSFVLTLTCPAAAASPGDIYGYIDILEV